MGIEKFIYIGEMGWVIVFNSFYGLGGLKVIDEYKFVIYYKCMWEWIDEDGISCFYFEVFDENWKDVGNLGGFENYFGLFMIDGKVKYVFWDMVDVGVFKGLGCGG